MRESVVLLVYYTATALLLLPQARCGGIPTYGFVASSYSVAEDVPYASVCVSAMPDFTQPGTFVTVKITATDGTAELGIDYTFSSVNLIFEVLFGTFEQCVNVTILPNTVLESDKTFTLNLEFVDNPIDGQLGISTTTITITNDDTISVCVQPTLNFPGGSENARVCVSTYSSAARDATVVVTSYTSTSDNACGEITETAANLVIEAGSTDGTMACLEITNTDDMTFTIILSTNDSGVVFGNRAAAVTFEDEMECPTSGGVVPQCLSPVVLVLLTLVFLSQVIL